MVSKAVARLIDRGMMEGWFVRLRVSIQAIRIIVVYRLRLDILELKLSNNLSTLAYLDYLLLDLRSQLSHIDLEKVSIDAINELSIDTPFRPSIDTTTELSIDDPSSKL